MIEKMKKYMILKMMLLFQDGAEGQLMVTAWMLATNFILKQLQNKRDPIEMSVEGPHLNS